MWLWMIKNNYLAGIVHFPHSSGIKSERMLKINVEELGGISHILEHLLLEAGVAEMDQASSEYPEQLLLR